MCYHALHTLPLPHEESIEGMDGVRVKGESVVQKTTDWKESSVRDGCGRYASWNTLVSGKLRLLAFFNNFLPF